LGIFRDTDRGHDFLPLNLGPAAVATRTIRPAIRMVLPADEKDGAALWCVDGEVAKPLDPPKRDAGSLKGVEGQLAAIDGIRIEPEENVVGPLIIILRGLCGGIGLFRRQPRY